MLVVWVKATLNNFTRALVDFSENEWGFTTLNNIIP